MNADIKKLFQYRDDGSFVTKPPGVKVETIGKLVCGMLNARGGVVMIGSVSYTHLTLPTILLV